MQCTISQSAPQATADPPVVDIEAGRPRVDPQQRHLAVVPAPRAHERGVVGGVQLHQRPLRCGNAAAAEVEDSAREKIMSGHMNE